MVKIPEPEKIVEFNLLALALIKVKKSDQPKVMSEAKIMQILHDYDILPPLKGWVSLCSETRMSESVNGTKATS